MEPENTPEATAPWDAINQHSNLSMCDPKGNTTFVSETFVCMSGYSCEELPGQNHRSLKTDVQSADYRSAPCKTNSSRHVWKDLVFHLARNGFFYWVEAQVSPFFEFVGNIEKCVSIRTEDIAPRHALVANELASSLVVTTTLLDLTIEARHGTGFVFEVMPMQALVEKARREFKLPVGRLPPSPIATEAHPSISTDPQNARQTILNVLFKAHRYSPAVGWS